MSEIILTRERRDAGKGDATTNCVVLSIIGCNRGESEFYYEALLDFLNKRKELEKEYYAKKQAGEPS